MDSPLSRMYRYSCATVMRALREAISIMPGTRASCGKLTRGRDGPDNRITPAVFLPGAVFMFRGGARKRAT
ncbi:MAG: hypothetical protein NFCOHLIN_01258 [Gammaproteobacteria bacterium]|nr:hypothetical protein [Gammaproteobacteria bacterium]